MGCGGPDCWCVLRRPAKDGRNAFGGVALAEQNLRRTCGRSAGPWGAVQEPAVRLVRAAGLGLRVQSTIETRVRRPFRPAVA